MVRCGASGDIAVVTAFRDPVTAGIASAYTATGSAWQRGPGRIYDRLAEVVVGASPIALTARSVLDVGAGTGAASRAALTAGAGTVVATDVAATVLLHHRDRRPPAVMADARALPFAAETFDVAVAAFSLNHLTDPVAGLREMARGTRPGGAIVAASYAADDHHPVKAVVSELLRTHGWRAEPWYQEMQRTIVPLLATGPRFLAAAQAVGLSGRVEHVRVPFPALTPRDLVEWRLGMAQHAPFVAGLPRPARDALVAAAIAELADVPPLIRSILVFSAVRP